MHTSEKQERDDEARGDAARPAAPCFDDVCTEHFEYIWASLHRLGVRGPEAEDLAHDVLLTVHRRLHTYDPSRPLRPWLFGITHNVVRDHRRRRQKRLREEEIDEQVADEGPSPSRSVERADAQSLLRRALAHVPEPRRAVFVLHDIDQVTMREVTEALGIPLQTGYSRLRKAREELEAILREMGADHV